MTALYRLKNEDGGFKEREWVALLLLTHQRVDFSLVHKKVREYLTRRKKRVGRLSNHLGARWLQ